MQSFGKKGNSIIEVIVVLVILTVGLAGGYQILARWNALARTTEDRIQAINIARDGIESVKNIRDTNWVKFSSDTKNCFDTKDYGNSCIGNPGTNKITAGTYSVTNSGWLFYLAPLTNSGVVYFDANGLVSQTGSATVTCSTNQSTNCRSKFYREIRISRPGNDIKIDSVVSWSENSKNPPIVHQIDLDHTLTNWKYEQTK